MKKKDVAKMTQEELVLDYLGRHKKGITSRIAIDELGIMQLPRRIFELKRRGVNVKDEVRHGVNRFGKKVYYKVYTLSE